MQRDDVVLRVSVQEGDDHEPSEVVHQWEGDEVDRLLDNNIQRISADRGGDKKPPMEAHHKGRGFENRHEN